MTTLTLSQTAAWQGQLDLPCVARHALTPDSASFEFAVPAGFHADFRPGQFISLGPVIAGRACFRAYSIASSPNRAQTLTLGIKRVDDGLVSNYVLDTVFPGMTIAALAPAGEFYLDANAAPDAVVLLSAGSGITPMLSMAYAVLESERATTVHFIHSARGDDDVMFADELQALAARDPRFHLELFLSRPQGRFACHAGRLDGARLRGVLPRGEMLAFLCGQDGYMDMVDAALRQAGVARDAIRRESFVATTREVVADARQYRLAVPGFDRETTIADGESLLDALEREGLPIIGACRTGVCGSCKCRVIDGDVASTSQLPLSAQEIEDGYVLACSSQARGDVTLGLS